MSDRSWLFEFPPLSTLLCLYDSQNETSSPAEILEPAANVASTEVFLMENSMVVLYASSRAIEISARARIIVDPRKAQPKNLGTGKTIEKSARPS